MNLNLQVVINIETMDNDVFEVETDEVPVEVEIETDETDELPPIVEADEVDEVLDTEVNEVMFEYSIKIVNPLRMSQFKNVRVCKWKSCRNLKELRNFLGVKVPSVDVDGHKPNYETVDVGYIEPGHGLKGKKQWLFTDGDVEEMYKKHLGKRNIHLWAYSCVHSTKPKPTKRVDSTYADHKENLDETNEKYDELCEKHGSKYTSEQLKMWAQYIRLGKHDSTDEAPDKPFWKGRKRKDTHSQMPLAKRLSSGIGTVASVSPIKKVSVRSELLDQLGKWHKLNENGVVCNEEYEELKRTILSDIKQL